MTHHCHNCGIRLDYLDPKPADNSISEKFTEAVTYREGGEWVKFSDHLRMNWRDPVYAVLFTDGTVWRSRSGIEPVRICTKCNGTGRHP